MKISKYQPQMYPKIRELLKNDDKDPRTGLAWDMELFRPEVSKFYTKFVAIETNKVVGVIVMSMRLYTAEINFVYVHQEYRGKGIAQKLAKATEQSARAQHAEGITINCGQENESAQKFNRKIGLKEVGRVKNYFSNNNTQIFYWKKL
ncbi:MAG: GNAT family N-acetyltransferase [Candidatus Woesearchaeota archaeon]|nr:GNAT family N-acetyltransferase [Candidatus Woesearchaeota archaeon]